MNYANAERFLKSCNKIESQLKILYGGPPTQAFTDLVKRCSDRNITVRRYENELIDYGKLRNAIVHRAGGEELTHPYLSPLNGDFHGFPPVLIQVGTDEVLLDDSRELAIRMDAQGVDVDIDIYEGMWHVWHMYDVPEANMAVDKIHWFVHVTLKIGGLEKRSVHVGAVYRHFKGKRYRVLSLARHSETLEEMVVYQQLYGEKSVWVRPLEMFLGAVERDGRLVDRFVEGGPSGEE